MILLFDKTFEDLSKKAEAGLVKTGFSIAPGSIAKLLLNIINENLAEFYETLKTNHLQSFVSTATGQFLEAIGRLVNCDRITNETDDDYRFRITKQILTTATANETAIRMAALSVDGVQDIVLKNYSYGAGSFSVLVITDKPKTSELILMAVRSAVEKVAGYGIKFEVGNPEINTIKIKIKLLTKDYLSDGEKQNIKSYVKSNLKKYFTSRHIGEGIIINEITQRVMEVNDDIIDYTCEEFRINNKMAMFINQDCRWNERYMMSSEPDAIIIN